MTNNLGFSQLPIPGLARGCRECRHWRKHTDAEAASYGESPNWWGTCQAGGYVNVGTEWDFCCNWFRRRPEPET